MTASFLPLQVRKTLQTAVEMTRSSFTFAILVYLNSTATFIAASSAFCVFRLYFGKSYTSVCFNLRFRSSKKFCWFFLFLWILIFPREVLKFLFPLGFFHKTHSTCRLRTFGGRRAHSFLLIVFSSECSTFGDALIVFDLSQKMSALKIWISECVHLLHFAYSIVKAEIYLKYISFWKKNEKKIENKNDASRDATSHP